MLTLKTEAPTDIPTVPSGKVTLFADSTNDDIPSYKDSGGDVHTLVGEAGPAGAAGPTGSAGPAGSVGPDGPPGSDATVTKAAVLAALGISDLVVTSTTMTFTLSGGAIAVGPAEP